MTEVFLAPIDFNKDTNMKFTISVLLYAIKKAKDLSLTFLSFIGVIGYLTRRLRIYRVA